MTSLGSLLVGQRVRTVQQVRNALTQQVLFGGTLDTVLLEGGCPEPDLLEALAEVTGYPAMSKALMLRVNPEMRELLSIERSLALDVCPMTTNENGRIVLLAGAKADFVALDELAFALEWPLEIYSALELRLWQARAAVYGVELPARFAELDAKLSRRVRGEATPGVAHLAPLAAAIVL